MIGATNGKIFLNTSIMEFNGSDDQLPQRNPDTPAQRRYPSTTQIPQRNPDTRQEDESTDETEGSSSRSDDIAFHIEDILPDSTSADKVQVSLV